MVTDKHLYYTEIKLQEVDMQLAQIVTFKNGAVANVVTEEGKQKIHILGFRSGEPRISIPEKLTEDERQILKQALKEIAETL